MAYITREDGERFVIPSYRDVITATQKSQLKKEILALSQNYGEYITLQRKAANTYEVAFSPDAGYLLGESIWHYFKRPNDMIYCEAIANTTEAILVIVKNGSVYLDGSFPLDSIPEELVIFLTQKNNFEIYTYGDVPISQTHEAGKFSFEPTSVKSFSVLDKPVFPTLPLLRTYQLQLVETVLRQQGIGVFPTRSLIIGIVALGLIWMAWSYLTEKKVQVTVLPQVFRANPYDAFNTALMSPAPDQELNRFFSNIKVLWTLPGWSATDITYANGTITVGVQSSGGRMDSLIDWGNNNDFAVAIDSSGVTLTGKMSLPFSRVMPNHIYPLRDSVATLIDRIGTVYPGNNLKLNPIESKNVFNQESITITLSSVSPFILVLISEQFKDLPIVLQNVSLTLDNVSYSGSINVLVLGS